MFGFQIGGKINDILCFVGDDGVVGVVVDVVVDAVVDVVLAPVDDIVVVVAKSVAEVLTIFQSNFQVLVWEF